jgi:hypothetical protein
MTKGVASKRFVEGALLVRKNIVANKKNFGVAIALDKFCDCSKAGTEERQPVLENKEVRLPLPEEPADGDPI